MSSYKGIFLYVFVLAFSIGCSSIKFDHKLSEDFSKHKVSKVAVAPIVWQAEPNANQTGASSLLGSMATERLAALNYQPIAAQEADSNALDPNRQAYELAALTGSDAVLVIKVMKWHESFFATYASIRINAVIELYSADGAMLWSARYRKKESDIRLDKEAMELSILRAIEPKLQRLVDSAFETLPRSDAQAPKKTYFRWLP